MLRRTIPIAITLMLLTVTGARAETRFMSGWEASLGAGVAWADYKSTVLSPVFGRFGLRFWDHLALGAAGAVDTERYLASGFAALYLNPNGMRSMYVRGEYGKLGDYGEGLSDTDAIGYAVGVTFGRRFYKWYFEYHHLEQPGYSDGLILGFIWYQRR